MNPTPGTARRAVTRPRSSAGPTEVRGVGGGEARRAAAEGGRRRGAGRGRASPRARPLRAPTPLRARLSAPGPGCSPGLRPRPLRPDWRRAGGREPPRPSINRSPAHVCRSPASVNRSPSSRSQSGPAPCRR